PPLPVDSGSCRVWRRGAPASPQAAHPRERARRAGAEGEFARVEHPAVDPAEAGATHPRAATGTIWSPADPCRSGRGRGSGITGGRSIEPAEVRGGGRRVRVPAKEAEGASSISDGASMPGLSAADVAL